MNAQSVSSNASLWTVRGLAPQLIVTFGWNGKRNFLVPAASGLRWRPGLRRRESLETCSLETCSMEHGRSGYVSRYWQSQACPAKCSGRIRPSRWAGPECPRAMFSAGCVRESAVSRAGAALIRSSLRRAPRCCAGPDGSSESSTPRYRKDLPCSHRT